MKTSPRRNISEAAKNSRKIDPERIWVGGSTGSQTLVRYRPISTSPGRILHPTAARSEKQEGSGQRKKQRRPLPAIGPSVCPVSSRKRPTQTSQISHCRWSRLNRYRCPHTNISDRQGGATERPCHQRVRLGQGSDSAPHLQTARRHTQDQSAVD